MSLCKTIAQIANELKTQLPNLEPTHQELLSIMVQMPQYLKKRDLALWDKDYKSHISPDEDESNSNFLILEMLYELAAHNLYGPYEVEDTQDLYVQIVYTLRLQNIQISANGDVSTW